MLEIHAVGGAEIHALRHHRVFVLIRRLDVGRAIGRIDRDLDVAAFAHLDHLVERQYVAAPDRWIGRVSDA